MTTFISPYIRRAWDRTITSLPWVIRERDLWDYELLYIKEGEVQITVDSQTYNGSPGDVFLFKPRQKHSIRSEGTTSIRQPHIHFDLVEEPNSPEIGISFIPEEEMNNIQKSWFRKDQLSHGPLAISNHIRLRHPAVFEKMLYEITMEFSLKLPYSKMTMKGQFIKLLSYLLREQHWNTNPQVQNNLPLLLNIQQYLSNHTNCDVTLEELSSLFHLSKYYLAHLFRKAFQMSPIKYHQIVRMEKAKQLIQFTDMSINDISEMLGYPNIYTFSRAFKNIEGVAPSDYRRRDPVQ
jgi:AraC-like DNA-binding protein